MYFSTSLGRSYGSLLFDTVHIQFGACQKWKSKSIDLLLPFYYSYKTLYPILAWQTPNCMCTVLTSYTSLYDSNPNFQPENASKNYKTDVNAKCYSNVFLSILRSELT